MNETTKTYCTRCGQGTTKNFTHICPTLLSETISGIEEKRERATSDELKQEVIEGLLEAWKKVPELRLGQLIMNCMDGDFYYMEDFPFMEAIEKEVKRWSKSEAS